ncbi:UBP1-associated proteins 1C [Porphyridium purpureum]|uniref:UBP1-associated proteins 1C n=1 Tax=Porphyridium purpureum TaxID=35688 RepID=A0A5J4YL35_PORPP|nr:UBP1-associated proteins 1C [Porphyridium purpureum]|eukprot:POR1579..scf261_15
MPSFSCGKCQGVFKKPKVQAHMASCRPRAVACLDCSAEFSFDRVKEHTACITEAEKYEGPAAAMRARSNSQAFCASCSLVLNGAVHAEQHYASKKHRAAERRASQQAHAASGSEKAASKAASGAIQSSLKEDTQHGRQNGVASAKAGTSTVMPHIEKYIAKKTSKGKRSLKIAKLERSVLRKMQKSKDESLESLPIRDALADYVARSSNMSLRSDTVEIKDTA